MVPQVLLHQVLVFRLEASLLVVSGGSQPGPDHEGEAAEGGVDDRHELLSLKSTTAHGTPSTT